MHQRTGQFRFGAVRRRPLVAGRARNGARRRIVAAEAERPVSGKGPYAADDWMTGAFEVVHEPFSATDAPNGDR